MGRERKIHSVKYKGDVMADYIWYSGPTDITGKALAESLEMEGGKTKPTDADIVICWGCKTTNDVNFRNEKVINHPNNIRDNRNKWKTLQKLMLDDNMSNKVAIACTSDNVLQYISSERIKLPLIGRTNMHQSGKGFWLCPTVTLVKDAISKGAQYFQEFIDIDTEYRLHVFDSEIIYAQKKVTSENSTVEWIKQRKAKVKDYAEKNDISPSKMFPCQVSAHSSRCLNDGCSSFQPQ